MNNQLKMYLKLSKKNGDFSRGDIAKEMGFNRASVYNIFREFIKDKILVRTRIVSGIELFRFNIEKVTNNK